MNKLLLYIPIILQFAATLSLLSVVCISSTELPLGELAKQWKWLSYSGIIYACCIGISLFFYSSKNKYMMLNYISIIIWSLIILGGWQAVLGFLQLNGFAHSNHSSFAFTGSFLNPGPYSGYLAMIFPVCLSEYYRLKKIKKESVFNKIRYYFIICVLLLILCLLPAGMSRSAWFATGLSSLFVVGYYNNGWSKFVNLYRKNKKKIIVWSSSCTVCLIIGLAAVFYLKKDSANGRLFMWKISLHAIAHKPFTGYGPGGFPVAYGNAQEAYFANGNYAAWEEYVAGSPDYAFNEYLQIALEWGLLVLLFYLLVVGGCFWWGLKKHRINACSGVLSVSVFAFSSYPFQLPAFIFAFFILLFACVMGKSRLWLLSFLFIVGITSFYLMKNNDYAACKKWKQTRILYNMGCYESAKNTYITLYPILKNRKEFMFEYGRCLNKLHEYETSNQILKEASHLTSDPIVYNLMGKNYQAQGRYKEAEKCFLRSVNRLPCRIYPYYLLAKLYAQPAYYQWDKFEYFMRIVMEKQPKVHSAAINEMREDIQTIKQELYKKNVMKSP